MHHFQRFTTALATWLDRQKQHMQVALVEQGVQRVMDCRRPVRARVFTASRHILFVSELTSGNAVDVKNCSTFINPALRELKLAFLPFARSTVNPVQT